MRQQGEQVGLRMRELDNALNSADDPIEKLEAGLQDLLGQRNDKEQELTRSQQTVSELDNRQRELESERSRRQQQATQNGSKSPQKRFIHYFSLLQARRCLPHSV